MIRLTKNRRNRPVFFGLGGADGGGAVAAVPVPSVGVTTAGLGDV